MDRRDFLTSAASGLGAAALLSLLRDEGVLAQEAGPLAPKAPHHRPRATRCIFVFLAGGASQVELFDPKPRLVRHTGETLPPSVLGSEKFFAVKPDQSFLMGTAFGFQRYGACGMELSTLLPETGASADRIALVRSMHTDVFDHGPAEILCSTGVDVPGRPSAGAWVVYGLGSEARNLPGYVVLMTGRAPVSRTVAYGNGFLPTVYGGTLFQDRGEAVLNLSEPPGTTREMQRLQVDAARKLGEERLAGTGDPAIRNRIEAYELAFRMQAGAPELIDLSRESRRTLEDYGAEREGEGGSFGTNCLLARRLVERGVRFVTLFHRRWDHHSDVHSGVEENCRVIDRPIGALLRDLAQRGLLDETLVVCATEFGRTPITQNKPPGPQAGRDHHRLAYSSWMAGGGVRGGQVIGATDEFGWRPVDSPVHVHDFNASMLALLGLDHLRLVHRFRGLDVRLTNQGGKPVSKLWTG
jgi:hypothetical protein